MLFHYRCVVLSWLRSNVCPCSVRWTVIWQRLVTPGGLCELEFLQFKFCTKFLYAICLVFLRICADIRKALQAPTVCHEQLLGAIHNSLIFKKWHRFCRARICRFMFSPARGTPRPPGYRALAGMCLRGGCSTAVAKALFQSKKISNQNFLPFSNQKKFPIKIF